MLERAFPTDGSAMPAPQSRTDQAYEEIRRRIICGRLEPGVIFTEVDLARDMDMSKTPVREALVRLKVENFVQIVPRRGYMVAPILLSDINDLFAFRRLIEGEATAIAAERGSDEDIGALVALAQASDAADQTSPSEEERRAGKLDLVTRLNNAFHESIAMTARNRRLHRSAVQVIREFERFHSLEVNSPVYFSTGQVSHGEIAGLIAMRDAEGARRAVVEHLDTSRRILLSVVTSGRDGRSDLWL